MPTFNTGNDLWDQGVGSLAGALFPDPSRAAQGYLYGSQARREQLLGNELIDKQNARSRFNIMSQGNDPGAMIYTQPQQTGAAPILAPPPNIQMQGQPLSTAVAGGWRAYVPQTMSPQEVASQAPTYAEPFTKGKPPPVSRPSAVSGPSPNSTTSNGQEPENDYGSGPMQPASISTENGGPKQASPANTDGSPMPATFNLAHYVAMAVNSGMDAAQASLQGQAMVGEMYRRGQISKGQWMEQLASVGAPTPFTNAQTVAGGITQQQIASGATIRAAEIGAAERRHATDVTAETARGEPVFVADPNDPTKGQWYRRDQAPGRPGYNPASAATVAQADAAVGQYYDKTKPGEPARPYTAKQARENPNLTVVEPRPEAVVAGLQQQLSLAQRNNDAEEVARLQRQINALSGGKPTDAAEQFKQAVADRDIDQKAYPTPAKGFAQRGVKAPVALDEKAESIVQNLMRRMQTGPDAAKYVSNPALLRSTALEVAKSNGLIQSTEEVNKGREAWPSIAAMIGATGDPRLIQRPLDPKNPSKTTPHLAVRATKKGLESGLATGVLSGAVTTPAPTGPQPVPPQVVSPTGPTPAPTLGTPTAPQPQPEPTPPPPSPIVQPTAPAPAPPAPQPQAAAPQAPPAPVGPPPTNVSSFLGSLFGAQPQAATPAQPAPTVAQTPPDQRPNAARILSLLTPNRAAAPIATGMPVGALGPAPPGAKNGDVVVSPSTGKAGIVVNGWVVPQAAAAMQGP